MQEQVLNDFIKTNIDTRLTKYSKKLFNKNDSLSRRATKEILLSEIKKIYLDNQHLPEQTLIKYLSKSAKLIINNLVDKTNCQKIYTCSYCDYNNITDPILIYKKNRFHCNTCLSNSYTDDLNKKAIYTAFSSVKKVGTKCNWCNRYVPTSYTLDNCPYDRCNKKLDRLENKKLHYISYFSKSLDIEKTKIPTTCTNSIFDLPDKSNTVSLYKETINSAIKEIKQEMHIGAANHRVMQKTIMLKSISNIASLNYTEFMVYMFSLNSRKHIVNDIFQEYVRLVKSVLPFDIVKNKTTIHISSLLDKELNIFYDKDSFTATVDSSSNINNLSKKYYSFSNRDVQFFMGYIEDIICEDKSIVNDIKKFSFNNIIMNDGYQGKEVLVKYYQIVPHHRMDSLSTIHDINKALSNNIKTKLQL